MTERRNTSDPFRWDGMRGQTCPKRPWVLGVLSDDEAYSPSRNALHESQNHGLPLGLAVHLRQCPSCRAVANDLVRVSAQLGELSSIAVPGSLIEQANDRVKVALEHPARLMEYGRTSDLDEFVDDEPMARSLVWRWLPTLAAASLLIAVGTASWFAATRSQAIPQPVATAEPVWPFDDDVFSDVKRTEPDKNMRASVDAASASSGGIATDDADGENTHRSKRVRPRQRIVYYRSHIDAAMADTPGAVQAAVVMPGRRETSPRTRWREVFDRSGRFLFTPSRRDQHKN